LDGAVLGLRRENCQRKTRIAVAGSRAGGDHDGWRALILSEEGEQVLYTRFLFDATGRSASMAQYLGTPRAVVSDRLVCRFVVLPRASCLSDLDGFSLIEATADGWWYFAVLPSGGRVLAFYTDSDLLAARLSCAHRGFLSLLETTRRMACAAAPFNQFDDKVGRASSRSQLLPIPGGEGWCAVGDAAMAFDPLSSQGLFNALYTGLKGAEAATAELAGNFRSVAAYRDHLIAIWNAYQLNLKRYYRIENRFSNDPFWKRRCGHPQTR
jgi:flavin-dependent dehydrogenase